MITSFNIKTMPLNDLSFVGALLFKEYPSTMVYADQAKTPYVVEWVDVDEAGADKFFIFKTSLGELKNFADQKISHYELILSAESGVVMFYEGYLEEAKNIRFSSVHTLPTEYIPSPTSYFVPEDSEDIRQIIEYFGLADYKVADQKKAIMHDDKKIVYFSEKNKTDLFCLHLNENKFVGHGNIQTEVLANTLASFESLYHEIVNDRVKGKDRTRKVKGKLAKFDYENLSHTQVVIKDAASFAVYVRPISKAIQFNFESSADYPLITQGEEVFQELFDVICKSKSSKLINSVREKFSYIVFEKLRDFVTQIKKYDLVIDLNFYSPITKHRIDQHININEARHILNTLTNTLINEHERLELVGRFTALNCNTGYFSFIDNQDQEFSGKFDDILKDNMPNLNFIDFYDVAVERELTKNIADEDYKTTNLIVSAVKRS